jgi:hypothetical protein
VAVRECGSILEDVVGRAVAAYIFYNQKASGSAPGKFATAQTLDAITVSDNDAADVDVVPCTSGETTSCTGGTPGVIGYKAHSNNPDSQVTWTSPSVVFTTPDQPSCASFILLQTNPGGGPIPAGGDIFGTIQFKAKASTPGSCSAVSILATFDGSTTTP